MSNSNSLISFIRKPSLEMGREAHEVVETDAGNQLEVEVKDSVEKVFDSIEKNEAILSSCIVTISSVLSNDCVFQKLSQEEKNIF